MRTITKNEVVKILREIKAELLREEDIADVRVNGLSYIGDNMLEAEELKFDGRVKSIIEAKINDTVDKSFVYGGIQFVYNEEDKEIFASIKVKVFTSWEVTEEYITVAELKVK